MRQLNNIIYWALIENQPSMQMESLGVGNLILSRQYLFIPSISSITIKTGIILKVRRAIDIQIKGKEKGLWIREQEGILRSGKKKELIIEMFNSTKEDIEIEKGDVIGTLVLQSIISERIIEKRMKEMEEID